MPDPEHLNTPLPMLAPCQQVGLGAPWRWFKLGLGDTFKAPLISLFYGFVMSAMMMATALIAWRYGSAWIMLIMLCGVVFIAPLACIGTYAISAQLERGQPVSIKRTFDASFKRYIGNELVFTLVLLIVFLLWARATSMISIFLPSGGSYSLQESGVYFLTLAVVCSIFMGISFAASVFALPMIMHRDVDAITAVVTSINAVLRNKAAMLVWALLIALMVVVGMLTGGIALILILPALGHAAWHGYLETIDATGFPLHKLGVTATRRPNRN
jgi:uncharacterized membrane protein